MDHVSETTAAEIRRNRQVRAAAVTVEREWLRPSYLKIRCDRRYLTFGLNRIYR